MVLAPRSRMSPAQIRVTGVVGIFRMRISRSVRGTLAHLARQTIVVPSKSRFTTTQMLLRKLGCHRRSGWMARMVDGSDPKELSLG